MQREKNRFDERGVTVVVVSFAQPERLADYQQRHQWPFVVLADPDRKAYHSLSLRRLPLFRVFSPSTLKLYFRLLREGRRFENYGKDDYFQAGGDFLLDRKGTLLFTHHSHDPSDRPSINRLLGEIDKATKES